MNCKKCGKELKEEIDIIRTIITYSPEGKKEEYYCIYCNATKDYLEDADYPLNSTMEKSNYQIATEVFVEFIRSDFYEPTMDAYLTWLNKKKLSVHPTFAGESIIGTSGVYLDNEV